MFPRSEFSGLADYERIINQILKFDIPFSILKFNLTDHGIDVKLEIPKDKYDIIKNEFKKESVKILQKTIKIDENTCIDCGQCISLCNTGALYFDEDLKRQFCEEKCVGCFVCVDACCRRSITKE